MQESTRIVLVSASFAKEDGLHQWMKKYGQFSDDRFVYLHEFAFTSYPVIECDAVLILNTASDTISTNCPPENIIAFMMEPGIQSEHPWMFKLLEQYARVFSPLPCSTNTEISHGYLGWYPDQDLHTLSRLAQPVKTKTISCIASSLKQLHGHRLRLAFVDMLKTSLPSIEFFGKGSRFIADKLDGLLPYRYSIAMENASLPFYFTEKINDCFLAWTVPIYHGCMNIGRFFPERSFVKIDIRNPGRAIATIRNVLENDDWNSRINALEEARQLVLTRYQPLAGVADIIRRNNASEKKPVIIKPVAHSTSQKIRFLFQKLSNNRS